MSDAVGDACGVYDAQTGKLYFVEAGTEAGHYKDGTLKVITGLP